MAGNMLPRQVFAAYDIAGEEPRTDYRFCPSCGSPLAQPDPQSGKRPACSSCGWVYYRNPFPGVVTLIAEGDRVLLGKRSSSSFAHGKWCLPGGFVEYDEDFLTAAIREAREETGLDVEIQSILTVVTNYLSPRLHTLVVVMLARVVGGTQAPGDDLVGLEWFPLAGPFPDMAFEADRHIIERYYQTRLEGAPVDPEHARPNQRYLPSNRAFG